MRLSNSDRFYLGMIAVLLAITCWIYNALPV